MPRRCPSCGEPGHNVATFCGRCGALSGRDRASGTGHPSTAAPELRRLLAALGRIRPRQAAASVATLAVVAVLASGLEVDGARGEVTVPTATTSERGVPTGAASMPVGRPSPAPPPELAACEAEAATPFCLRWRHPRRHDQVVLADSGAVLLGGATGGMVALDRRTGALRWSSPPELGMVTEAAVGPEGLVVAVGGPTPEVSGLDRRDGTVQWSTGTSSDVELDDEAGPGFLFEPWGLRSIDPATGASRWSWRTEDPTGVALVAGTAEAPVVASGRTLTGLDPAGDEIRWQLTIPALRGIAPAGDGRLVAVDGEGGLVGIDTETGAVRWRSRLAFGDRSGVRLWSTEAALIVIIDPPLADDGTRTPRVVRVDPASGEVQWVHLYRSSVERRGVVLEPTAAILVGTTSAGTIAALDLGTGSIAWQRDLGAEPAHVRVVGGLVLAASGRDIHVLSAADGSVEMVTRSPAPVIGIVDAVPGSAVLRTPTELVAVSLPTGG